MRRLLIAVFCVGVTAFCCFIGSLALIAWNDSIIRFEFVQWSLVTGIVLSVLGSIGLAKSPDHGRGFEVKQNTGGTPVLRKEENKERD